MAPRANWKGALKVGAVSCPVALYTAASTAERISFHILNRKTGHRVHREFVDSETGKPVDRDDQIKGYETGGGDYITFEPEEIAKAVPDADKTLSVEAFVRCDDIDDVYFDRPYYLAPAEPDAAESFTLLRDALREAEAAAIARTVLFRRVRSLLIRAHGAGMIATTLNFDYEIRSSDEAFAELPEVKADKEMLDLARHIIRTKAGRFDPEKFDDRYEAALVELVKAKMEGRKIAPPKPPEATKPSDLMEALRRSAAQRGRPAAGPRSGSGRKAPPRPRTKRRKAA
ncbi:MAG: Ku protein [Alphaproteobacteria bacterium]|nr:Ku protein [Alphaproteobacteria bacterium]